VIEQIFTWALGLISIGLVALIGFVIKNNGRLSTVENDVKWIIRSLGVAAGQTLHSPHTPELDHLIEKYEREELLWHEVGKFARMLKTIANNSESIKGDKLAATILLMSLEKTYGDILKGESE
jgi:hypothetical protein